MCPRACRGNILCDCRHGHDSTSVVPPSEQPLPSTSPLAPLSLEICSADTLRNALRAVCSLRPHMILGLPEIFLVLCAGRVTRDISDAAVGVPLVARWSCLGSRVCTMWHIYISALLRHERWYGLAEQHMETNTAVFCLYKFMIAATPLNPAQHAPTRRCC